MEKQNKDPMLLCQHNQKLGLSSPTLRKHVVSLIGSTLIPPPHLPALPPTDCAPDGGGQTV